MQIRVNGEIRQVPPSSTVSDLIAQMGLNAQTVAVEVNRELVTRSRHGEAVLKEGDELEVVTLVGGG